MDKRQENAVNQYNRLIKESHDLASTVGRTENELGMAKDIWNDIQNKLFMESNKKVLEIGCGYGELTETMLEGYNKYNQIVTMLDIESVITAIKTNFSKHLNEKIELVNGIFPYETELDDSHLNSFDYIIVYSVIHYTDEPKNFVLKCLDYLAPGGKLLIADLPNSNKRGRFLASQFGRKFEANWKKVELTDIPEYKTHHEYVDSGLHNTPQISDEFVLWAMTRFRESGYDVFMLPQNKSLPYHYTREDMLLVRPFE